MHNFVLDARFCANICFDGKSMSINLDNFSSSGLYGYPVILKDASALKTLCTFQDPNWPTHSEESHSVLLIDEET